jgi:hypothetical protein
MSKCHPAWQALAAGVVAALILVLLLGPVPAPAGAQPAAPPVKRPIYATSPLVISGAAFSSDGYAPASMFFYFWGGYLRGDSSYPCMKAPVYVPNRAKMTGLYASVYDNDASAYMWIALYRVDNYTGAVSDMAFVQTTDNGDYIQVLTDVIDYGTVEYPTYSYYVGTCIGSTSTWLYSVRVYFDLYRTFLPTVLKRG